MANNLDPNPSDRGPGGNPQTPPAPTPASNFDDFKDLTNQFVDKQERQKYANWALKYPSTIESGQDRITITQMQYVPGINISGTESSFSGESRFSKQKMIGMVTLPMPNDITESNSVGWGEDSLGNFAALVMPKLIDAAKGISEADMSAVGTAAEGIVKGVMGSATGTRFKQYMTSSIAASVLKKANINVNPEAYISRATGSAVNPNLELLFSGPKLRQFGFAFKMTPRSKEEARAIRGIIQFFKKGMAPRRTANSELSFFLGAPNVFKVHFKSGNNELRSIGKFKTCALVSFNVNYTPDGFYAAYSDAEAGGSQPVSVTMQMGFSELTPVFSDEFDLDDDKVNLGPSKFTNEYDSRVESGPNYTLGSVQGPDPSGRTIQEQQQIQQILIESTGPLPGGG